MSEPSFRFLDLPPELRCMVYEQLEMTTKHYTMDYMPDQSFTITLVCKKLPVQILATSKLINTEAMQIFRPRVLQLKVQPMRFCISVNPSKPLSVLRRSLSRCFRYNPRPDGSPPLSEAAEAFIDRCVKTRRLASSCRHVEIMLIDKDAPSLTQFICLLYISNKLATRYHLEITLLRKELATGINYANWCASKSLGRYLSMDKSVHLHLADEPDAERWMRDWEETTSVPEV